MVDLRSKISSVHHHRKQIHIHKCLFLIRIIKLISELNLFIMYCYLVKIHLKQLDLISRLQEINILCVLLYFISYLLELIDVFFFSFLQIFASHWPPKHPTSNHQYSHLENV